MCVVRSLHEAGNETKEICRNDDEQVAEALAHPATHLVTSEDQIRHIMELKHIRFNGNPPVCRPFGLTCAIATA